MSACSNDNPCETRFATDDDQTTGSSENVDVQWHDFPSGQQSDTPLPRSKRKRKRAREDRGLPPDEELAKLAATYLERQHRHWPKLVEEELLPGRTEELIHRMLDDFKERHRTGEVDPQRIRLFARLCPKIGGCYNRYSCDNSSPTSALDQMNNSLDKAHSKGRFIPWEYVFADYSVTGLAASRQGYSSCKSLLSDKDHPLETTYIDDFTRASRDELE